MKDLRKFLNPSVMGAILAISVLLFVPNVAVATTDGERHPVNCATAEGDLRAIAAEKKHAQDQQLESVAAITLPGHFWGWSQETSKNGCKCYRGTISSNWMPDLRKS